MVTAQMITRAFRPVFSVDARLVWTAVLAVCLATVGCDSAPLLAPTNSRITLTVSNSILPTGGSATLTATVLENSGSPVPNGTTVRFIASLGRVEPVEAQTSNGVATATFQAGDASGIAEVQALSGLATGGTGTTTPGGTTGGTNGGTTTPTTTTAGNVVRITVGAAAVEAVTVRANPGSVGPNGGSVAVTALVTGPNGRTIPGISVAFTANNGQLSPVTSLTNEQGEATSTLNTDRETTVRATAGTRTSEAITVGVRTGPAVTLTCDLAAGTSQSCSSVTIGQAVTFTVTPGANTSRIRDVVLEFGDGNSVNLGAVSAPTTVGHTYATAGSFTARATATDTAGEQVTSTQFIRVTGPVGLELLAEVVTGRRVRATATVTGLGNASVVQYEWTFEGGTPNAITTNPTAEFTYTSGGTKTITVRVTLTDGRTSTASATVTVPT